MEENYENIPYEVIVEVAEVHGCKTHNLGQKWVLNEKHPLPVQPTERGRGVARAHNIYTQVLSSKV